MKRQFPESVLSSLRVVAEGVFSTADGPPSAARLDWLVAELDDFLRLAGTRARLVLRLALFAVMWLGPLFVWSLPTLGRLSVERRVLALTRMEHSALSGAVLAVKALMCLLYYEHPDVQREVGYVGFGRRGDLPLPLMPGVRR